jgi:hypothetical protein
MNFSTFTKCKTLLASSAHGFLEARRQRLEDERQFYRNLKAYCRANNLSPICEDDWKTAACDNTDDISPQSTRKKMYHEQRRTSRVERLRLLAFSGWQR